MRKVNVAAAFVAVGAVSGGMVTYSRWSTAVESEGVRQTAATTVAVGMPKSTQTSPTLSRQNLEAPGGSGVVQVPPEGNGVPSSDARARLSAVQNSFEGLLSEARTLNSDEVERRLKYLNDDLERGRYIERANSNELTETQRAELSLMLSRRDALSVARMERMLAEMDEAAGRAAP